MTRIIKFTVPGRPHGKRAPSFNRATGHAYKNKDCVSYENRILACFVLEAGVDFVPHDGPVQMCVKAYAPIPSSKPKWFKAAAATELFPCCVKPDTDNLQKSVADAIEHAAYTNDSRIYRSTFSTYYSSRPRLDVTLWLEEPLSKANWKEGESDD